MESNKNTKRIVKNTLLLYMRSIIVMLIALYTSRVVLQSLGIEDFGLYNVVGGVVALFSFLRTSMTKSTQRFLNVEMTKPDGQMNKTFCVSLNIHLAIAFVTLVVTESIGLWFLNTYIQIPAGREFAANVIYQSTIISLIVTIVSVPYSADIIAHEEMGFFAVVSIIDAILRLAIALAITWGSCDRLILYGFLMASVSVLNLLLYVIYCRKKYVESKFIFFHDRVMTRKMLSYTTWTVVGQAAIIGTNHGNNLLMNMFHGVVANAAMGIAHQVNGAIVTLTSNFQTAFNPQITKSYAAKDYEYLKKLVYSTSKISFILLVVVSLPIMFNMKYLLQLWLGKVPTYSEEFCILILCNSILNAMSAPFNFTVLSSGKIKWFQIVTSIAFLSDLIVLFPLFLSGFPAVTALVVKVASMVLVVFVRIYFAHREVECIDIQSFIKGVFSPLAMSTVLAVMSGLLLFHYAHSSFLILFSTILLFIITLSLYLLLGLSDFERKSLYNLVIKIVKNKKYA